MKNEKQNFHFKSNGQKMNINLYTSSVTETAVFIISQGVLSITIQVGEPKVCKIEIYEQLAKGNNTALEFYNTDDVIDISISNRKGLTTFLVSQTKGSEIWVQLPFSECKDVLQKLYEWRKSL